MVVGTNIDKVYMVMDYGGMDLKVQNTLLVSRSCFLSFEAQFCVNFSSLAVCTEVND